METYNGIYQPKNREESLSILAKYKDKISDEIYVKIEKDIWGFATEDMFLDEQNIQDSIAYLQGDKTHEELEAEIFKRWEKYKNDKKLKEIEEDMYISGRFYKTTV
ncbi:MAG: hypothetical protein LBP54_02595 [Campylobacteraceae bacterium]|jgi:hypothetical protein|nr:hypothetical protein [Campylobacteraceae bacterium]